MASHENAPIYSMHTVRHNTEMASHHNAPNYSTHTVYFNTEMASHDNEYSWHTLQFAVTLKWISRTMITDHLLINKIVFFLSFRRLPWIPRKLSLLGESRDRSLPRVHVMGGNIFLLVGVAHWVRSSSSILPLVTLQNVIQGGGLWWEVL